MTSEDNKQNETANIDAGIFLAYEVAPLSKITFFTIPSCVGLNTAQLSVPLRYLRRYLSGTAAGIYPTSCALSTKDDLIPSLHKEGDEKNTFLFHTLFPLLSKRRFEPSTP
jgi:hypothetical protein